MKRTTLSPYAKRNKTLYDLKKYANGVLYLRSNNLRTVSELQSHISELKTENNQIFEAVKEKTQRIENLNKCFGYAETIRATKDIFIEWQNKKLFKDNFYNANKNEIDQYQRARTMLEKLSVNNKIQPKKWTQEVRTLEREIEKLNGQSESIKEKYNQINHIKYAVGIVNEEYGIGLSIEIDKAIKRGEKESIIKQLQEFKKDSNSYNRKRQATKDYYKNKDTER